MSTDLLTALAEQFPGAGFGTSAGQDVVRVERDDLVGFVTAAREAGFVMFADLCGVDYLTRRPDRFEVMINLIAPQPPQRLRILVGASADDPVVPSITGVFAGANFYEREAFDLFGIRFEGHPDLTRILLPDEWEGHPLRKDSPVGAVPVQFKGAPRAS